MHPSVTLPRLGLVALLAVGVAGLAVGAARAEDPPAPKPTDKPAEPPKADPPKAPTGDEPGKPKEGDKPAADKPPEKPKPKICDPLLASEDAKDFTLKDLDGKDRRLSEFKGKWVVLEWTNLECGYVKKFYKVTPAADGKPATPGKMPELQKTYTGKGVIWLSICSSGKAADGTPKEGWKSRDAWKEAVKERMAVPTAVLLDEDGKVGREVYGAKRTPTVWIVDPRGKIAYHGAPDDDKSPKGDPFAAKNYVAEFLDAALAGKELPASHNDPYG